MLIVLTVGCLWRLCFRKPLQNNNNKHNFTVSTLEAATDGFSKKNRVGKSVYRGILRDGSEVRIEIYLNNKISRSRFVEECEVLVRLRHKNLVRVCGWCCDRSLRALVTEWPRSGGEDEVMSVEMWVLESGPSWKQRLKVLVGVLKGMRYLQEQWPEVGYDLRATNVLVRQSTVEPLIARFKVGEYSSTKSKSFQYIFFLRTRLKFHHKISSCFVSLNP